MLPSMRFFMITIVSIFAALGIGIFIGFTLNTQDFALEQNAMINKIIESQVEVLVEENKSLKARENLLIEEANYKDEYIDLSYYYLLDKKLDGLNVGIIETNEDYARNTISKDLEEAGARVVNSTVIRKTMQNREDLNRIIERLSPSSPIGEQENLLDSLTKSILRGQGGELLDELKMEGFIETMGSYQEEIDYLIICGGSFRDESQRIQELDRLIVEAARSLNIPVIGVENSTSDFSYMAKYKELGITTIDNIDMTMGRVALILAMEGLPGDYGIKKTAGSVIPNKTLLIED